MHWYTTTFAIGLLLQLAVSDVAAQEAAEPAPKAPACPGSCRAPRSAMDALAAGVAAGLVGEAKAPVGTMVFALPLDSDAPAPRADALGAALVEQIRGRLRAETGKANVDLASARDLASEAPAFVLLRPRLSAGKLSVAADVYPVARTVWARARAARPGPVKHTHVDVSIDAEIRGYLQPLSFERPQIAKYDGSDRDVIAIACGDLDEDGALDLVTMTRRRVLQLRLIPSDDPASDGTIERVREVNWADLAELSPNPLRQPIGFATIVPANGRATAYLDVGITDRMRSARLNAALQPVAHMKGLVLPSAERTACTWIHQLRVHQKVFACFPDEPEPALNDLGHGFDALATTVLVDVDGGTRRLAALRRDDGALALRGETGRDTIIGRVGAQVAVGDIDQDGAVDVVTTLDVLSTKHDAITVRTLLDNGTVQRRYVVPAPGVEALTICAPDGSGRAPIVAAAEQRIWVLR